MKWTEENCTLTTTIESYIKLLADHYIVGISSVITATKQASKIKQSDLEIYKNKFFANAQSQIDTTFFKKVVDEVDERYSCKLDVFRKVSVGIIPSRVCFEMKQILLDIFKNIEHDFDIDIDYKKVIKVHGEISKISVEYYRTIESAILEMRVPDVSLEDFMSDAA